MIARSWCKAPKGSGCSATGTRGWSRCLTECCLRGNRGSILMASCPSRHLLNPLGPNDNPSFPSHTRTEPHRRAVDRMTVLYLSCRAHRPATTNDVLRKCNSPSGWGSGRQLAPSQHRILPSDRGKSGGRGLGVVSRCLTVACRRASLHSRRATIPRVPRDPVGL